MGRPKKETTAEEAAERTKSETRRYAFFFTQSLLGTTSANKEIFTDHQFSKRPPSANMNDVLEEELEAITAEEAIEKGTTVFPRTPNGIPFIYDYQIAGFFKSACKAMRDVNGTQSKKLTCYKSRIDEHFHAHPRRIPIINPGEITINERPLRAQTMQGERVSLARSEEIGKNFFEPDGNGQTGYDRNEKCPCIIVDIECCRGEDDFALVEEWLDYGAVVGLLQWRNSGHGQFIWDRVGADNKLMTHHYEDWKKQQEEQQNDYLSSCAAFG